MVNKVITIWTVGHSTRSLEDFKNILGSQGIQTLVDVRSFPGSRRYPHFSKANLAQALQSFQIIYVHQSELGGRRKQVPHSKNTALRNSSFRAYADHMESDQFKTGIDELIQHASTSRTAIMCAEALWWRCHRSLIADYLTWSGVTVLHILDENRVEKHQYSGVARVIEGKLSYEGLLQ